MHEVSIMQSLFEHIHRCSAENHMSKVTRVVVRIGDLVSICKDSLHFAFDAVSLGTIAENAEFIIESVAGRTRCMACGVEAEAGHRQLYECALCAGAVIIIAGRELDLQTIEGEQEEVADEN